MGRREGSEDCGPGGDATEDAFWFCRLSRGFSGLCVGYGDDLVHDFPIQHRGHEPCLDALNQVGASTLRHPLGAEDYEEWFARHLVDPRPVIRKLTGGA